MKKLAFLFLIGSLNAAEIAQDRSPISRQPQGNYFGGNRLCPISTAARLNNHTSRCSPAPEQKKEIIKELICATKIIGATVCCTGGVVHCVSPTEAALGINLINVGSFLSAVAEYVHSHLSLSEKR